MDQDYYTAYPSAESAPALVPTAPASAVPPKPLPWYSWRRWGWNFLTFSILLHVLFGVIAAFFIVATIAGKKKPDFQAPGPKGPNAPTRALEHKVSMAKKQSSMSAPPNPKRVTTTGISKTSLPTMAAMPQMTTVVPAQMSGMAGNIGALGGFGGGGGGGGGDGGGGGGLNFFGVRNTNQGLVGTFYDLKQNRGRGPTGMTPQKYSQEASAFINGGWNVGVLSKYFAGPQPVRSQQIFVPSIPADQGPAAFGLENLVKPSLWMVHYKGVVSPTQSGTYHFVGGGDDLLMVRFNGKLVLSRNWDNPGYGIVQVNWKPQNNYDYHWPQPYGIPNGFAKGDGIAVEAGQTYQMEVLIGEQPGGYVSASLLIQKDGDSYEQDQYGNQLFPVFRLTKAPLPPPSGNGYAPHAEKEGPVWNSMAAMKNR